MQDDARTRIEAAFATVEQRVQALANENRGLKERVRQLESELAEARRSCQDLEHLHSRRIHIREKLERVLQSLEALKDSSVIVLKRQLDEDEHGNSGKNRLARSREDVMIRTDERFYQELLDNLNDGVYFVDRDRRITYWSKGAERITGYLQAEVVGRCCSDNILNHVDDKGTSLCLDRCPLSFAMEDGIARNGEVFLHHKAGHRVPVTVRAIPMRNAQGGMEGAVEIFNDNTYQAMMLERIEQCERLAYLDELTGAANRRFTEMTLQSRIDELHRYGWPFGILFIDVDRFKDVNDQHGHAVGDQVLAMAAKTLSSSVRSFDFIGRWGGEEFLAILANVDAAQLHVFANRIRALVEQSHLAVGTAGRQVRVTVSIGATIARSDDSLASLVKRADEYMYASKKAGRNRVTADE